METYSTFSPPSSAPYLPESTRDTPTLKFSDSLREAENTTYRDEGIPASSIFKKYHKVATFRPLVKVLCRKGTVYLDLGDHINKYVYPLTGIPDAYGPRHNYEFDPTTGGPIRIPYSGETGEGMYSISWMIDAFYNKTPFTFRKMEDVCHVVFKLEEYLDCIATSDTLCDKSFKKFLDNAIIFFNYLAPKALSIFKSRGKEKIVNDLTGRTFIKELNI